MKKVFSTLLVLMWTVTAFAQSSIWTQEIDVIVELEIDNGSTTLSVFNMPQEEQDQYYLCVGSLGIGDDFVQLRIDPVSQLFIPLGNTLEDAQAKMEEIKAVASEPRGTVVETSGILAVASPALGDPEPVYLTARRVLLSRKVEFSVQRNGYVRATYVTRSDLGSLLSSVKFHRQLHPDK